MKSLPCHQNLVTFIIYCNHYRDDNPTLQKEGGPRYLDFSPFNISILVSGHTEIILTQTIKR